MHHRSLFSILVLLVQSINYRSTAARNPFQYGCLSPKLDDDADKQTKRRVCNSNDEDTEYCEISRLGYPEVRIHNGNWESSMLYAWITQIVLMELARVPAAVGLRTNVTAASSFYSPENTMEYSETLYPWDGLERAHSGVDCNAINEPCVHFLPEVWPSRSKEIAPLIKKGVVYSPTLNGLWARSGLYIPTSTAKKYGKMLIWYGLSGERHRKFLAETFPRPTNWSHYCSTISETKCKKPDDVAVRSPKPEENDMYFSEGNFTGHFQFTEQNNCTINPECTGPVFAPPCSWAFNIDSLLFWKNMSGLSMEGPIGHGRYTAQQLQQIWRAANATNSDIISYWYEPDPFPLKFAGSNYSFQRISFPSETRECLRHRTIQSERCSADPIVRQGDERGACLAQTNSLQSVLVKPVTDDGDESTKEGAVYRSPAQDILKQIKISNLDIDILLEGLAHGSDPRQLVCQWVIENREELESYIPIGYPRQIENELEYNTWINYLAWVYGAFVIAVACLAIVLVAIYRNTKTMILAQPVFLYLILMGYIMYSAGSILYSVTPSSLSCNLANWLTILGYTIELVPIILKTAAMHYLVTSAKKRQRVNISRNTMLLKVAVVVFLISAYMTVWTIFDPSTAQEVRYMDNFDESTIVVSLRCGSNQKFWRIIFLSWQGVLLLMATVLAIQSQHDMAQFNESSKLAFMVYCHFLFLCGRVILYILHFRDIPILPEAILAGMQSFASSADALCAMAIYICPKLFYSIMHPEHYKESVKRERSSMVNSTVSLSVGDELHILVCTANLGNTQPTKPSMLAWIPPSGKCCEVTTLRNTKGMPTDSTFDIIAIGMQEATWNSFSSRPSSRKADLWGGVSEECRKEELSQEVQIEEVLSAMDDENTSYIYNMTKHILGRSYMQIASEQRGQMRFSLWASDRVQDDIHNVKVSGANTGVGKVLANKGGIVASLNYKNTQISFLSAHLTAHEGESNYRSRCESLESIFREGRTSGLSKKLDDSMLSHHMFVFGDLNFRINFGSEAEQKENVRRALEMIENKDYAGLYRFDELQAGLSNGDLLANFKTPPCNFPPTFKVRPEENFVYKEQRIPSYTDRILYKSAESLSDKLELVSYEACSDFITSDHKPVRGAFTLIPNAAIEGMGQRVSGTFTLTMKKMKAWDLPAADADGYSDPYLMFLWNTGGITHGSKSISDRVRMLIHKKSWPRTRHISKNLNPDWGDAEIVLTCEDIHVGQMLYIAAVDYDCLSKDDVLGVASIDLKDLISTSQPEEETIVERALIWGGKEVGHVQLTVDISRLRQQRRTTVFHGRETMRQTTTFKPGYSLMQSIKPVV